MPRNKAAAHNDMDNDGFHHPLAGLGSHGYSNLREFFRQHREIWVVRAHMKRNSQCVDGTLLRNSQKMPDSQSKFARHAVFVVLCSRRLAIQPVTMEASQ